MFKIRFNLGRGKYYKMWKVVGPNKIVAYFNPIEVSLMLENATLKNKESISKKIFEGENKRVCAWIECNGIYPINNTPFNVSNEIKYNPRISPNWEKQGVNVDEVTYDKLITMNNKIFEIKSL